MIAAGSEPVGPNQLILMVVWGARESQDHDGWGENLTLLKMFDSHKLKFKQLAPFYANAKQVKCIAVDSVAVSPR